MPTVLMMRSLLASLYQLNKSSLSLPDLMILCAILLMLDPVSAYDFMCTRNMSSLENVLDLPPHINEGDNSLN